MQCDLAVYAWDIVSSIDDIFSLPVNGQKFRQLVPTLDDACKRFRDQRVVGGVARHLADQQKLRVAQLHSSARFNGKRGYAARLDLRDERADVGCWCVITVLPHL